MTLHRLFREDLVEILVKSSLRDPSMTLCRPLWGDLLKILLKSSKKSSHDLVQVPLGRPCGHPGDMLSCLILYRSLWADVEEVLMKSSRCPVCAAAAAAGPFMSILWDFLPGPGMKILLLCADLVEILVKCCPGPLHDLVRVLVKRSCGDPVEILFKRSLQ